MNQFAPFDGQPINALQPDDGQYQEYQAWNVRDSAKKHEVLPMGLHLVFDAIAKFVMSAVADSKFIRARNRMNFQAEDFQVMHFRRVCDQYDISRVTLFGNPDTGMGGNVSYVYIVLGVKKNDAGGEDFKLRGVSFPMPILTPETGWCHSRENWYYWRED